MTGNAVGYILERLGQCRMSVHIARNLIGGQVPKLRESQLRQQLSNLRPDHVQAQDLAVLGIGDQFDEARGRS